MNDLEISRSIRLKPLTEVARIMGLGEDDLEFYGTTKAKVKLSVLDVGPADLEDSISSAGAAVITIVRT